MIKKHYKHISVFLIFAFLSIGILYLNFLFQKNFYIGHDMIFHLNRIESLYLSLKDGVLFPLVSKYSLNGYGYAFGLFYSNIFLYPAAFARQLGFSITTSYIFLLTLINFLTFGVAYFSFIKFSKSCKQSFAFSVIYTLSTYRILNMVTRAALGELIALSFIPLVILGIYEIINGDGKRWYYLTIGMSCIAFSHVITLLICGIFVFIYCVLNFNEIVKKEKLIALLKATIFTILISSLVIFPIAEQCGKVVFRFSQGKWTHMYLNAPNIFTYFQNSFSLHNLENGGILLTIFIAYLIYNKKMKNKFFPAIVILLFLASNLFPWYFLKNSPLDCIQFPWRFLGIITCLTYFLFLHFEKRKVFIVSIILASLFLCISQEAISLNNSNVISDYGSVNNQNHLNQIAGAEYLPCEVQDGFLDDNRIKDQNGTPIDDIEIDRTNNQFSFVIQSEETKTYVLPLLYYYGYGADSTSELEIENIKKSDTGLVSITIRGQGRVFVEYKMTTVQKLSALVTIFSAFALIFIVLKSKKTILVNNSTSRIIEEFDQMYLK